MWQVQPAALACPNSKVKLYQFFSQILSSCKVKPIKTFYLYSWPSLNSVHLQAYQHWARPPWRAGVLGPVGRGHCMALRRDARWDSFRCPNKFPYLCERSKYTFVKINVIFWPDYTLYHVIQCYIDSVINIYEVFSSFIWSLVWQWPELNCVAV